MTSDPSSWPEAKAVIAPGPITNFRRGYKVDHAGRHENSEQYRAFQYYMAMGAGRSYAETARVAEVTEVTISNWAEKYQWQKRAAYYDKQQMMMVLRDANKLERRKHRESIERFRATQQKQAEKFVAVSDDIINVIKKRIEKAEQDEEEIPMTLVSGLMRAAANISEQGRQAWATSLGISELMHVVDHELEQVDVEDVTDVEEIPLDE